MSESKSSDGQFEVPITDAQGVSVGSGTQYNYYGTVVQIAAATGREVAQVLAELAASSPGRLWNVPFPPNPFFTGREEALTQLAQALSDTKKAALTQAAPGQTLSGLGGVGKTQTAVEYAYRHREDYRFVLWAQADTAVTLDTEFRRIAGRLILPQKDAQDADTVREAVKRWLETQTDYLLILDNADDPPTLKAFLPPQPAGHVLITSRARNLGTLKGAFHVAAPISLPMLTPEQSVAFLLARTERPETQGAERTAATALAKELGGLPLALEQAGAYIAQSATFADYLTGYHSRRIALLEAQGPEIGDSEKTVAVTWSFNFEAVERASAAAAELLRVSAFLSPDRIPEELFTGGAAQLGETLADALKDAATDPLRMQDLLAPLMRYSLIERDVAARTFDIHRLVQAVIRHRMDEAVQRTYAERTVHALNATFPLVDYSNWPLCERLLTHALLCTDYIETYRFEFAETARLLNETGYYLHQRAQYSEAKPLLVRALAIREATLGHEHPDIAQSLNNIASLYHSQGKYAQAEPLLKQALAISEQALGPEHPATAQSVNNLAMVYISQGNYIQAEPLSKQALAIREVTLGPEHPATAQSLNILAGIYDRQGKYAQAEPLFKQALAIREATLGPEHPTTAVSLNNLAGIYTKQGKFVQAEILLVRALAIVEQVLGPKHPTIANSLSNLAGLYDSQGKYTQAEPLHKLALAIRKAVLGPEHPTVANSLNNLAGLYDRQGKYAQAETIFKQALAISEKALGQKHPNTALVRRNYTRLQQQINLSRKPGKKKYEWWKKPGG